MDVGKAEMLHLESCRSWLDIQLSRTANNLLHYFFSCSSETPRTEASAFRITEYAEAPSRFQP